MLGLWQLYINCFKNILTFPLKTNSINVEKITFSFSGELKKLGKDIYKLI